MSLPSLLVTKMMHSILNVIFDDPGENDVIGVEVMLYLFWKKPSHDWPSIQEMQTELDKLTWGSKKKIWRTKHKFWFVQNVSCTKCIVIFLYSTKTKVVSGKWNLNKMILAWKFRFFFLKTKKKWCTCEEFIVLHADGNKSVIFCRVVIYNFWFLSIWTF